MNPDKFFIIGFIIWYFTNCIQSHPWLYELFYQYAIATLQEYNFLEKYDSDIQEETTDTKEDTILVTKPVIRYEDKYLKEIRQISREIVFDEKEQQLFDTKFHYCSHQILDELNGEIDQLENKLDEIETKLNKYASYDDAHIFTEEEDADEDELVLYENTKEEIISGLLKKQKRFLDAIAIIKHKTETPEGAEIIKTECEKQSREYIIKKRLQKLKNCFIIENTPLGNVLMLYDVERESFTYYSDNSIPYRYLEVVARKYVKQFCCRIIYIDMEEELKFAEHKCEQQRIKQEEKLEAEQKRKAESIKNQTPIEDKKNVFAKFKSYNKEAGTGHVNTAPPPKNSIPNKKVTDTENEKVLLKERSNRYTYEGKFANFSFIKKIDKKLVNKKLAMSFADFKKQMIL